MNLFCNYTRQTLAVLLLLTGLCGCVSSPKPTTKSMPPSSTAPVVVVVTPTGAIRYQDATFAAEQLPRRLASAGVEPTQEIRVHIRDDVSDKTLMPQIYNALHAKGYSRVLFQTEKRASSEVLGDPQTHSEALPGNPSP